ncbi:hypothetical protein AX16_008755 [Volvariella volvacea WC 439]|nr:hypothetical protein AX16_008755 [Volvariella volvacea WC 439]
MMGFNEDYFFHDGKNGDHQPGLAESPTEMAMLPTPSPEFDGGFGEQVYQKEEDKGRVAPSSLAFLRSPRHDPNIAVMRSGDEGEGEGRDVDAWGGGDVSGASMKVEELMMDRHVVEHSTRREVDDGGDGVHVPFEPAPQKAHPAEPGQEAELGQDRHLEWDRLDYGYPRKSLSEMSEGSSSSFLSSSSSSSLSIRSASPTQDSNMALSKSTSPTRNKLARSQSERHPRRSPRHQRPDRSGVVRHKSGRVKGMVESFEKNASFDELMESPTKAGLSRSQSLLTHANHHRNRSSTSSVSSSVSSGIGSGSLSRSNSAAHRHHSRHSQETTRHHFHELIAPSIVGGAGAKVEGYINRARSGSTSSNTSASGDEYGWKNAHSYTLVAKKESRPLPIPPSWASTSTDSSSRDSGSSGGVVRNGVGSVNSSPVKGSHWVQNDRRNSQQDSAGMGVSVEQDSIFQRPLPQPPTWAGGNANGTAIEIATIKPVKSHPSGNVYSTTTASASASDVFETATEGDLSEFGYGPRLSVGGSRGSDQIKERAGQRDDLERRWEGDSRVDADDPAHATVKRVGGAIGANGSAASAGLVLVLEQQQHPQNTQPESLFVTPNGDPSDTQSAAQRYEEARSSPTLAHYENHHEQHRHGEQQPADRQLPNCLTAEAQLGVVQQPVPRHHNPSGHLHSRSLPVPPVSVQQESNTKRDDEEELTMEELLAQVVDDAYSTGPAKETRPAGSGDSGSGGLVGMGAGAAAWELADVKKGNTVKRVPGTGANVTQPPVERKKTPSTAVTLKDGEPPFIVAPSLPAGLGHERKSSIQFAKDQSASPVEGPEETEEEERGRAAIRGRVKKGGSLKEAGKEKRVGLNEIFANPDLADRRSPHLEKTRARERDREDHKEIGERPDRYRHGKKMSASEKQFMEDLAKATEELEKEKERRERAEVEQVGQTRQVKEGEDEEIKRLREEMEQTRKMVEAIQLRVEEVERKVAELEALEKQREQSNTVSREIEPSTEDEPEEELSEESVDKQQSAPSSRWSGLLSNPRTVVRRMLGLQKETNGHGKFPRGEPSNISGIPSYVFLVGIGVCAVVLKVVLKRALVKGVAGR